MKANCYKCGMKFLICHEAWPQVRVLIDPETGMPHRCNPRNQIIQEGKWKNHTYGEMAQLWWDQKQKDKKRLDEIRRQSSTDE